MAVCICWGWIKDVEELNICWTPRNRRIIPIRHLLQIEQKLGLVAQNPKIWLYVFHCISKQFHEAWIFLNWSQHFLVPSPLFSHAKILSICSKTPRFIYTGKLRLSQTQQGDVCFLMGLLRAADQFCVAALMIRMMRAARGWVGAAKTPPFLILFWDGLWWI